jgi:tetratricopeptide (TPR) repeat protein
MRKTRWGEAARLLERARADQQFSSQLAKHANLLLADCCDHLLNPDQKLEALRRALEVDPHWLPAGRALALALAQAGKVDLAIAELRKLVRQSPLAKEDLARLLVDRNLRLPPPQRDWSEITRLLEELPGAVQQSVGVKLLQAEILALQGKADEARQQAEAQRDAHPEQVAPWLLLIMLAEPRGVPAALEVLDQAEKRVAKRVEWPLIRARLWLKGDSAEARKRLPQLLDAVDSFQGKDRDRLLAGLAEAFATVGDLAAAARLWSQHAERNLDNLGVRFRLFETALQDKDFDQAQRLLAQIKRIEASEGAFTAYGEGAVRLLQAQAGNKAKLAEARSFLTRAGALRPSWARPPLLEAMTYEVEGQLEKALEKYRAALERGEGRLRVVQRVLELMQKQGLHAEANALLRKLPEQALAEPGLGRLAGQVTLLSAGAEGQDPEAARQQALELARKTAANSKDHRDHLWLGQLAVLMGKTVEAEKALRRACELQPTALESWSALVFLLARTDPKKAETELAEASRHLHKKQITRLLAIGFEALGQIAKAEEHFQTLLDTEGSDAAVLREVASFFGRQGQLAKAEKTLQAMLRPEIRAPAGLVGWARRTLAFTLTAQGGYDRFKQAEALLKPTNKDEGSREDRLARAFVLAAHPAHRREAIQTIENLSREAAVPDELRFLLAQLHDADGNWPTAELHFLAILRSQERNPAYLDRYLSGLLRQGKADAAQPWLDKLVAVAPKALRTLELRIQVLKALAKTDEAAKLVKGYTREKDARLDVAAQWFELLGHHSEAEVAYRSFAASSKQPEAILLTALHLGRQKKVAEALAICEKAWATCRPEAVGRASVSVLRSGHGASAQWQTVEGWIAAAIKKAPQPLGLSLLLAEVYEQQGRHEDSIQLYRGMLGQDPRNVVALNNLAYLLALKGGKAAEALTLMNRAIDQVGPADELLDTRAVVYLADKKADLAVKDLQQAIAQAPAPLRYFHLAQAQHMANDRVAATVAWRKATEMGLQADDVHPMERAGYARLVSELN